MRLWFKNHILAIMGVVITIIAVIHGRTDFRERSLPVITDEPVVAEAYVSHIAENRYNKKIFLKDIKFYKNNSKVRINQSFFNLPLDNNELKTGNRIVFEGKLSSTAVAGNPGQFDEREFYYNKNIYYKINKPEIIKNNYEINRIKNGFSQLKRKIDRKIFTVFNKDEGEIISAMLLGGKTSSDNQLNSSLKEGGLGHLMAISGLHIGILATLMETVLKSFFVPMRLRRFLAVFLSFIYCAFLNFPVSAVRALIMIAVANTGKIFGRSNDFPNAISIAAVILLCCNYKNINNISFILSFSCVLGIALLDSTVNDLIGKKFIKKTGLGTSLSIFLFTAPIMSFFFYNISIYSVFINILCIPLSPFIIIFSVPAIAFSNIAWPLSFIFALPVKLILKIYYFLCRLSTGLPLSTITVGRKNTVIYIIYYILIITLIVIANTYIIEEKRKFSGFFLIIMFLPMSLLFLKPHKMVEITMLDVGQGEGIVMETENNGLVLIDGGSSDIKEVGKKRIIPFLQYKGHSKVDLHILTHSHGDHLSGVMEMIDEDFKIDNFILPGIKKPDKEYLDYLEKVYNRGGKIHFVNKGSFLNFNNLELLFIHPSKDFVFTDPNEYSTTFIASCNNITAMFSGDLENKGEKEILQGKLIPLDILNVAHHGSKNSTPEELIEKTGPKLAIISCGENNRYGHPNKELLERLEKAGTYILSTDKCGAVNIRIDSKGYKVYIYRKDRGYERPGYVSVDFAS